MEQARAKSLQFTTGKSLRVVRPERGGFGQGAGNPTGRGCTAGAFAGARQPLDPCFGGSFFKRHVGSDALRPKLPGTTARFSQTPGSHRALRFRRNPVVEAPRRGRGRLAQHRRGWDRLRAGNRTQVRRGRFAGRFRRCPVVVRAGEEVPKGNRELAKLGAVPLSAAELASMSDLPSWLERNAGAPPIEGDLFGRLEG